MTTPDDSTVELEITAGEAEELMYLLYNYINHHTEGDDYNGEDEIISIMEQLTDAMLDSTEIDYSADDIYAGGAE